MAARGEEFESQRDQSVEHAIYLPVRERDRLYQGEIVERVSEWVPTYNNEQLDVVEGAKEIPFRLAVVITQDCDLSQDWGRRESDPRITTDLKSVLLCPAYPAEEMRSSPHLQSSKRWDIVRQNKEDRYAYLAEAPAGVDNSGEGHCAILLDLKVFFSIRTVELYRQMRATGTNSPRRRFRLATPWREHLQSRFAGFHSRIGLPRDHFMPESRQASANASQVSAAISFPPQTTPETPTQPSG